MRALPTLQPNMILWPQRLVNVRRSLNRSSRIIVLLGLLALGGSALWVTHDRMALITRFDLLEIRTWFHPAYLNSLLVAVMILYAMRQVSRTREKLVPLGYPLLDRVDHQRGVEVWRSTEPLTRRPVHLHIISPDRFPDGRQDWQKISRAWMRRAEKSRQLSSPHIAYLIDCGFAQYNFFYAVMEMPPGMRLDAMVKEHGEIVPARAMYLLAQVAHAVNDAHRHGIEGVSVDPRHIWVGRRASNEDWVTLELHGYEKPTEADSPGRADIYQWAALAVGMMTGIWLYEESVIDTDRIAEKLYARKVPHIVVLQLIECLQPAQNEFVPPVEEMIRRMWEVIPGPAWNNDRAAAWWRENHTSNTTL